MARGSFDEVAGWLVLGGRGRGQVVPVAHIEELQVRFGGVVEVRTAGGRFTERFARSGAVVDALLARRPDLVPRLSRSSRLVLDERRGAEEQSPQGRRRRILSGAALGLAFAVALTGWIGGALHERPDNTTPGPWIPIFVTGWATMAAAMLLTFATNVRAGRRLR